ncbi:ATP-binding cassette domain-containing protein [Microbispora hainanensis]|uniref:ATP-binding cassette domain-containing protein n=1 Tax=Microbispora hainanensis TaxID=568844 RepID=UPI002E2D261A|nr:ATP-binding cassette domain-containing protein [Microbispora hainanensis]
MTRRAPPREAPVCWPPSASRSSATPSCRRWWSPPWACWETSALLSVRGLAKTFPVRTGPLRRRGTRNAVDGVDFDIPAGTTLGLVGESGSGKTTTARMILGLERPTAGSVRFAGEDVTSARGEALRRLRRRVQLVYQNPYTSLHPRSTVEDLLTEPMRNHGVDDAAGRAAAVRALLDDVALPTSLARRRAGELSGGQRQRVAIARALALNPDLLVCDEPVSALDVTVQAQILELLARLQRERGLTYLFISHDLAVVRQVSHTIAVMRGGRIVEQGDAEDVFTSPRHPCTRELLAAIPGFRTQTEEPQWSQVSSPSAACCRTRTRANGCPSGNGCATSSVPRSPPRSSASPGTRWGSTTSASGT